MLRDRAAFALSTLAALTTLRWGTGCNEFTIVAACDDGVQNGDETDIDCGGGGNCSTCSIGEHCLLNTDCVAGACIEGFCMASPPRAVWTPLMSGGGNDPPPRAGASFAYDPASKTTLLFGGDDAVAFHDDTWQWSAGGWKRMDTSALTPPARSNALLIRDGERLMLFGGRGNGVFGDFLTWNGGAWAPLMPASAGPEARYHTVAAYDSNLSELVLYGGYATTPLGDTWIWKDDNWTQSPLGGPPPRAGSTMAYDAGRKMSVLFGGSDNAQSPSSGLDDTWIWDGNAWVVLNKLESAPPPRYGAAMTYDSARKRVVLFGGMHEGMARNDMWEWNGSSWIAVDAMGPAPRVWSAMSYDPESGQVVLFGGSTANNEILGDTWAYHQIGTPCRSDADCDASLSCVDRVCCQASQCGACEACNLPDTAGECAPCGDACKAGKCGR